MLRHLIKRVHLCGSSVRLRSDKEPESVSQRCWFLSELLSFSTSKTTTVTRVIFCLIHGGELAVQVYQSAWITEPWITRGAKRWKMLIIGRAKRSLREQKSKHSPEVAGGDSEYTSHINLKRQKWVWKAVFNFIFSLLSETWRFHPVWQERSSLPVSSSLTY